MAKKTIKVLTPKELLEKDIKEIGVPFDLFTGLQLVVGECDAKEFEYSHLTLENTHSILWFEKKDKTEKISINIDKDNLLIRQFSILDEDKRKLKVLYVVKPTERAFKLV